MAELRMHEDPALAVATLDIIDAVLHCATQAEMAQALAVRLRELTGYRTVTCCLRNAATGAFTTMALVPERHRAGLSDTTLHELCRSVSASGTEQVIAAASTTPAALLLREAGYTDAMAVPLATHAETTGVLLLLGIPDHGNLANVLRQCTLIARHLAPLFVAAGDREQLEHLVSARTASLQATQQELQAMLQQVRASEEALSTDARVREKLLAKLRHLTDNHAEAEQLARLGHFTRLDVTGTAVWSDNCRAIFGVTDDFVPTFAAVQAMVHPDDRETFAAAYQRARQRGQAEVQYRIVRPDGEQRTLASRLRSETDGIHGIIIDVTEKAQLQEEARQSRSFADTVLQAAPVIIMQLDPAGKVVSVNPYFCELTGYAPQEAVGRDWLATFIPPAEQTRIAAVLRSATAGDSTRGNVNAIRIRNGAERLIEWHDRTLRDTDGKTTGIICVGIDVTTREEQRQRLQERDRQVHEALRAAHAGFWQVTIDDNRTTWSDEVWELLDLPRDTPASLAAWLSAVHPDDRDRIISMERDAIARGADIEYELRVNTRDGTPRWLLAHGQPVFGTDGNVAAYRGIIIDITRDRQRHAAMVRQERTAAIGQLAAGLAHNYNNLFGGLLNYLTLLDETPRDAHEWATYTAGIRTLIRRGADLSSTMLKFARGANLRLQRLDLVAEVTALRGLISSTFPKNITARFALPSSPVMVEGAGAEVQQLLLNLCLNARDAMPDGGTLEITLERRAPLPATAPPYLRHAGTCCCLRVRDTGSGIDAADLPRVFEPFYTTKGPTQGTGLGLSTAAATVRDMGGHIDVNSATGKGTEFSIYLPRADAAPAESAPAAPARRAAHLLLVDDDADMLQPLARLLEQAGCSVQAERDPQRALEVFRVAPASFTAVITDVVMPRMNGYELLQRLGEVRPGLPAILMSGYPDEVPVVAHACTVLGSLDKPFDCDALLHLLQRLPRPR